jgi:hypothetical protein
MGETQCSGRRSYRQGGQKATLKRARELETPGQLHRAGLVGIAEARRLLERISPELCVAETVRH